MEPRGHYAICEEHRPNLGHQNSRTLLLRDTSISSDNDDDSVFSEEHPRASLSIRMGSDLGGSSAVSFAPRVPQPWDATGIPRRNSLQDSPRRLLSNGRRLSLQDRPLPSIPTAYSNVDHNGVVKMKMARSASDPSHSRRFQYPPRDVNSTVRSKMADKGAARCRICFAILVCCLSFCACALSIYTFLVAFHKQQDYCLPCSDLTQPPNHKGVFNNQLTTKVVGGQELCCVNSSDGLLLLVTKVQQYERMNYAASQNMTSAHVGLYADEKDQKGRSFNEGSHYTLLVSPEPSLQHCQNVIVEPNGLSIVITGRYFVYSSIHFNLNEYPKACRELPYKTWLHHVYVSRSARKDTTALLRSEHTCCEECDEERTSGFTGGVFELYAGDSISVDVSAPPLVVDNKQTSYLGLFLVDKQ